ncbi:immunomodulatory protein [Biscogniauxia mediterranea]|nr:immunomodulatory protein [Biscogniauxia mediterranea]
MQFTTFVAQILSLVAVTSAASVAYDQNYDNGGQSTNTVACSDGIYGLAGRFPTFGSFPQFPYIGAADVVAGWNSPQCGTCWQLTWQGKSINVLAIDHAGSGFNIAVDAMNALTGGRAVELGRIDATATQVASSVCGI